MRFILLKKAVKNALFPERTFIKSWRNPAEGQIYKTFCGILLSPILGFLSFSLFLIMIQI